VPTIDVNGVRLCYRVEGDGPPVLLIQGAGIVGDGWRPQAEGLRDRYTLITFDNRGSGGSSLGSGPLSIEAMAGDALALMDAVGMARVHVAGHSMGGLIAQEIALTRPERVVSLALLCTFARGRQASAMSLEMLLTAFRMRIGSRAMRRNAFLELVMPHDYLDACDRTALAEQLRPLFGRDLADQPSIVMKQLRAMSRYDAGPRLQTLGSIPTLVVSATHDRIARVAYGRELARAIPGAAYVEVPDAGHGVTIQRAAHINDLLAAHLSRAGSLEPQTV
jgi:pimeloyl-ACP methyl ester carboxylesterase